MSSDAWYANEMGICTFSGTLGFDDSIEEYHSQPDWFATFQEASQYAKKNIGVTIKRSEDGDGFVINKKG